MNKLCEIWNGDISFNAKHELSAHEKCLWKINRFDWNKNVWTEWHSVRHLSRLLIYSIFESRFSISTLSVELIRSDIFKIKLVWLTAIHPRGHGMWVLRKLIPKLILLRSGHHSNVKPFQSELQFKKFAISTINQQIFICKVRSFQIQRTTNGNFEKKTYRKKSICCNCALPSIHHWQRKANNFSNSFRFLACLKIVLKAYCFVWSIAVHTSPNTFRAQNCEPKVEQHTVPNIEMQTRLILKGDGVLLLNCTVIDDRECIWHGGMVRYWEWHGSMAVSEMTLGLGHSGKRDQVRGICEDDEIILSTSNTDFRLDSTNAFTNIYSLRT